MLKTTDKVIITF